MNLAKDESLFYVKKTYFYVKIINMLEQTLQNPIFIASILLWTIPWKAVALWRAAKLDQKVWFGIILLVNTFGLLEIIYFFYLHKVKFNFYKKKPS